MKRMLFSLFIFVPFALFIMSGHKSKERTQSSLKLQIDSILRTQAVLQSQAINQYDSITKNKSLTSDSLFMQRVEKLKLDLMTKEQEVEYLRSQID